MLDLNRTSRRWVGEPWWLGETPGGLEVSRHGGAYFSMNPRNWKEVFLLEKIFDFFCFHLKIFFERSKFGLAQMFQGCFFCM